MHLAPISRDCRGRLPTCLTAHSLPQQMLRSVSSGSSIYLSAGTTNDTTALATESSNKLTKSPCLNCKKTNHCTKFWITAGSQMVGKTIKEAHTANDAAHSALGLLVRPHRNHTSNANTAATVPRVNTTPTPQANAKMIMIMASVTWRLPQLPQKTVPSQQSL